MYFLADMGIPLRNHQRDVYPLPSYTKLRNGLGVDPQLRGSEVHRYHQLCQTLGEMAGGGDLMTVRGDESLAPSRSALLSGVNLASQVKETGEPP